MSARRPTPSPSRRPPLPDAYTFRLRIDLLDTAPPIWRLIEVPSTLTLDALHLILQTAMGWSDSHLHGFCLGDPQVHWPVERYLTAFDIEEGEDGVAEADVRLDEVLQRPGDELRYTYDFGDGWDHLVRLEAVRPLTAQDPPAALLDGRRARPPEDCGGPSGYAHALALLTAAAAGTSLEPEDAGLLELTFGPAEPAAILADADRFDIASTDADLRAGRVGGVLSEDFTGWWTDGGDLVASMTDMVPAGGSMPPALADLVDRCDPSGRARAMELVAAARLDSPVLVDVATATTMVEPFAWLVRHVGTEGLPLTAQGYLRPADVRAVAGRLDLDDEWIGAMNRESLTPPVAELRRAAAHSGLVRVAKGRIHATARGTALADDPVALWWHIADRLPAGRRDDERDAGTLMLLALAGNMDGDGDLGRMMTSLGWRLRSGRTLDDRAVRTIAATTAEALHRLGCFDTAGSRHGSMPTAAGRSFARAALQR